MEKRRKRANRGKETNSIHLKQTESPREETKGYTPMGGKPRRREDSSSEEEDYKRDYDEPPKKKDLDGRSTFMADGFVVKDSSEDKYYVIKNNGLIADQSKQEYESITNEIRTIPFTVKDPTSNLVTLLKSPFKDRLETFYFPYPDFCIEEKDEGCRVIRIEQDEFEACRSYFRYDTNLHIYNSVVRACNEAGMFLKDKKLLNKYRYKQQKEK